MRRLFLLPFFAVQLFAFCAFDPLALAYKEPSRAKDFAAQLCMENSKTTEIEAKRLFLATRAVKPAHIKALQEKSSSKSLAKLQECRDSSTKDLLNRAADCQAVAFSVARGEHLSLAERLKVAKNIASIDPSRAKLLETMASKKPLDLMLKDSDIFYLISLSASAKYLDEVFYRTLTDGELKQIASDSRVAALIERAVLFALPQNLTKSLQQIDIAQLDSRASFYLGISFVADQQEKKAARYFEHSAKKAYARMDLDKANFWHYLVSSDQTTLTKVADSYDTNIYSLYAKELLSKPFPQVETTIKRPALTKDSYDKSVLFDPFYWSQLAQMANKKDKKSLEAEYQKLANCQSYRAFIEYQLDPSKHFFLDPFADLMSDFSADDKALFLAIMRQESRFMPAAISTSYALGSMQMMPFLLEHMMKEAREKRDFFEFFDPEVQIPYAKKHLKWLQNRLTNPLYIAYAYNGGIGYTKRTIENNKLFERGKYEPFLSMELVTIQETREYGKIVLANYAIYKNLLGKKTTIKSLLRNITPEGDIYLLDE